MWCKLKAQLLSPASQILHHPLAVAFFIFILTSLDKGLTPGQHEIHQPCQLVCAGRDGLGFIHARTQPTVMRTQCRLTLA